MVHPVEKGTLEAISRAIPATPRSSDEFGDILESAAASPSNAKAGAETGGDRWFNNSPAAASGPSAKSGAQTVTDLQKTSPPADSASGTASATAAAGSSLGEPDIQSYLSNYWSADEQPSAAQISYQPAQGSVDNFPAGTVYGPDAVYTQAVANQIGNFFAGLAGSNPATFTAQLPGVPSQQVQQGYDQTLAIENANRLASGQPIDTSAYWADPGPITLNGQTYTSQELGYVGPGQSSGPQPIFISVANQIAGTDSYTVGGYSGTVTGIQPGRYYTLQQLEQAGLPAGQPDTQFQPGSWSTTQNA